MALTNLTIGVLGPIRAERDGVGIDLGGPKQRAVLAMLVAGHTRAPSRDWVIEGVWGESASEANRRSFHTYVSNLRAALGDVIARAGDTYRLTIDPTAIDSSRFEAVVSAARDRVATDPGLAAVALREALATWHGRPYADLADVPGLDWEIRRLEELRLEAVELRIDAELSSGLHGSLIAEVEALSEEHPTRERFRAQHMLALYRSGRQSEALRAFRRTEAFLAEELGVEPSAELRDLELKILQHDESLLGGPGRAVTQRLAFLATDIEGSTRLWDTQAQAMAEILATHDRLLRESVEAEGGTVFRHTGHGVLAAFPSASAAVEAAEGALGALAAAEWDGIDALRIRVGIDVGEAEARGGDFFGPPVTRAVRLCSAGHGGQVLISESAQAEVVASARRGVQLRQLGEYRLRGAVAPERVAQLVFAGLPSDFPELRVGADPALGDGSGPLSLPGYEVRELLGEGALGVVWKAYQPSVGREVALKIIRPGLASQPSFVRRFEAQARTIARLAHPHIVPLIDFWRDPEAAYLVTALMAGGSLAEAIESGPIPSAEARRMLAQIGSAVDHAHSQGIVHGDLRPGNVLMDASGNAYLSDFRIGSTGAHEVTPEGSPYRAPELESTGPSLEADRYAFGVLVDRLLGELLDLAPIITRATAPDPNDRYSSCSALLSDLDRALGGVPESTTDSMVRNPYKGLQAFGIEDSIDFHGRDALVAALLGAVSEQRFVAVVGPSGSGKSSVVMAGLLPAIGQGRVEGSEEWRMAVMTPGADPIESLVEALKSVASDEVHLDRLVEIGLDEAVGGELLLVVDQFEELYTATEEQKRQKFVDLISDAVQGPLSSTRIVATLRADFYDRPLGHARLGRLVRDGLVTVLPPSGDELIEMITAPAQGVGLGYEGSLPHRIVEDVAGEPGGLPLLQYALTEMVERRSGDRLTAADYERVGGVEAALATRAETLFRGFTERQQELARQVFLRMVTVGEESDEARRRVRRAELESLGHNRADLDTVLGTLIDQRLLISDRDPKTRGPTVEIAHEALLREWPRLAEWVDDQRDALVLGRRFRRALSDWESGSRHDDFLLTGSRLAPFVEWADSAVLTPDELRFYDASLERDDAERAARTRRRRTLMGVLAGGAIVAGILATVAMVQANRASAEADRASQQAQLATAAESRAEEQAALAEERESEALVQARRARSAELSASARAALTEDPTLAKLLLLAAADLDEPDVNDLSLMHEVIREDRVVARYEFPDEHVFFNPWADLHPDGRLIAIGSRAGKRPSDYTEVYDLEARRTLWSYELSDPGMVLDGPFFIKGGAQLVFSVFWEPSVGTAEPPDEGLGLFVFDTMTGEQAAHYDLGRCGAWLWEVSDSKVLIGTFESDHPACFWRLWGSDDPPNIGAEVLDLDSGERIPITDTTGDQGTLSGDGRFVAVAIEEGGDVLTTVVDIATGETVMQFDASEKILSPSNFATPSGLNQDGSVLLADFRPVQVFDTESGERLTALGNPGAVWDAEFAPDGTVYTIGQSGNLHHWDPRTGWELSRYPGLGGGYLAVRDGLVLVTTDGTAQLLDVSKRGDSTAIPTCGGFVPSMTMNIVGDRILLSEACPDGVVTEIADLTRQAVVGRIPGEHNAQALTVAPDGTKFVRQDSDTPEGAQPGDDYVGRIRVRDLSGRVLTELEGICVYNQGSTLPDPGCVDYPDTPFRLWNFRMEWSPDSRLVAVVGLVGNGAVVVWDTLTGEMIHIHDDGLCTASELQHAMFSPDGTELFISCTFGLSVLDTGTWEVLREDLVEEGEQALLVNLFGYTPDGSRIIGWWVDPTSPVEARSLIEIDPLTFEIKPLPLEFDATPKMGAWSPDRSLIAIGLSDGTVKVWDVAESRVVHDIPVSTGQVQGVVFVDDRHIAASPDTGHIFIFTLDPNELVDIARSSLTRGLTPAECQRYGFGGDDPCPTLEQLRGGSGLVSAP